MKVKSFNIGEISSNVRKLPEAERRRVKENISEQLASGAISLGEGVRLMRLAAGMTQAQYAEMAGVDLRILAAIEKGKGNPRLDTLQKLGRPYGLMVSFVKPQPKRPLTAEERPGTDTYAAELRNIAVLLEKIAETASSDSRKSQRNHVHNNLSDRIERLTGGRGGKE